MDLYFFWSSSLLLLLSSLPIVQAGPLLCTIFGCSSSGDDANDCESRFFCSLFSCCDQGKDDPDEPGFTCPTAVDLSQGRYCVNPESLSWDDHQKKAKDVGGDLAPISGETTNALVRNLAAATGQSQSQQQVWLGGHDDNDEGIWVWSLLGIPFWIGGPSSTGGVSQCSAFTKWQSNDPNNFENEDCTLMTTATTSDGSWIDAECSQVYPAAYWIPFGNTADVPSSWECSEEDCTSSVDVSQGVYCISRDELSWDDHRKEAQDLGGDIAYIPDEATNTLVRSLSGDINLWLGGHDGDEEGLWKWSLSNIPFWSVGGESSSGTAAAGEGEALCDAYTNWAPRDPNNFENEDCTLMAVGQGGAWFDTECDSPYAAVYWIPFDRQDEVPSGWTCANAPTRV